MDEQYILHGSSSSVHVISVLSQDVSLQIMVSQEQSQTNYSQNQPNINVLHVCTK